MKLSQDQINLMETENGHTYSIVTDKGTIAVPSVTTVINAVVDKSFALTPWAYNVGVEETYNHLQKVDEFNYPGAWEECKDQLKHLKKTADDRKKAGGDRGEHLHTILAAHISGEDIERKPEYKPYLDQLDKWLDKYDPEFEQSEMKVASINYEYAGTLDLIATPRKHPSRVRHESLVGQRCLIDFKSNKEGRVYPQTMLPQVEGYANAYVEMGGDEFAHKLVVSIGEKSHQTTISYARADTFIRVLDLYNEFLWMKANNPNGRG